MTRIEWAVGAAYAREGNDAHCRPAGYDQDFLNFRARRVTLLE